MTGRVGAEETGSPDQLRCLCRAGLGDIRWDLWSDFPRDAAPPEPFHREKNPPKIPNGKKKRKKPPSTLFAWAGNEPRMPVFAYGGESRVHLRLQSHQRRFPPFLKEGTAVTAKPGRHPKGTEIPSCLKPSLLKRTRLII